MALKALYHKTHLSPLKPQHVHLSHTEVLSPAKLSSFCSERPHLHLTCLCCQDSVQSETPTSSEKPSLTSPCPHILELPRDESQHVKNIQCLLSD